MNDSVESYRGPQLVLLLGGPGSGKGTQAQLLSEELRVPHVSSGDLLRERQGETNNDLMSEGNLLPDEVVTELVLARLEQPDARRGAILDGFPRTLSQADALAKWLEDHGGPVRAAVYLDVPTNELAKRLISRGEISGRLDDRANAPRRRLDIFLQEFPPILRRYAEVGLLRTVDGTQTVDEVHRQVIQALGNPAPPAR